MSQVDLATKAVMPQSVIARIESGKHSFTFGTLDKIAHVLGKKIELR
jgi:predicted transcriptional regulator